MKAVICTYRSDFSWADDGTFTHEMPVDAKILHVGKTEIPINGGEIVEEVCLWAEGDPESLKKKRIFILRGANKIWEKPAECYIGSVELGNNCMFHLYEILDKD